MKNTDLNSQNEKFQEAIAPMWGCVGVVSHVNGQEATLGEIAISRYEATLLVEDWARQLVDVHAMLHFHGQASSSGSRIESYSLRRIREIVESGLVAEEDAFQIVDRRRQEAGIPPFLSRGPSADAGEGGEAD